ncbi:MAG TPA: chromosome segregation protein SMC [Steroidobacteraceae bacterium]|nr:chromosome segregation protein SMC [Steroidobacteraceae bacterium]
MRLTKVKLAGFKSFIDPTTISFPSNLTGVVGPNGCGKSNIIDAVRWVMGEISAKHLRGDSMADVIFNGSAARKPVGSAAIELVFDNADGKIGGEYANYAEIGLKRVVSRDGRSDYFINGIRVRRKDITQLFLGTGLGSRSYAIIEQGMISRLIEARADDMRAFLEEAAGISKYKERRRETENRIGHTRENLARLTDLREEVDKQIRHLQRQAATARRYQSHKEEERRLHAELLALRLLELDSQAQGRNAAVRERETALQAAIAELRTVEAAIEKARVRHVESNEGLAKVQGRYYQLGADLSRTEQTIQHTRELRQRQRIDLDQTVADMAEAATHAGRDEAQLVELARALTQLEPELEAARVAEAEIDAEVRSAEQALETWRTDWETFNRAAGEAGQQIEVERARIEQLEAQKRRLGAQQDKLAAESAEVAGGDSQGLAAALAARESVAREEGARLEERWRTIAGEIGDARESERREADALETARSDLQRQQGRLVSLEALQRAALGQSQAGVMEWLARHALDRKPRLAQSIDVDRGWERAVETVMGSYLEAVCVEGVDAVARLVMDLEAGQVSFVGGGPSVTRGARPATTLSSRVRGSSVVDELLAGVLTAENLNDALARRGMLAPGESLITPEGIWIGRHWLRVSRDRDTHAGVLEREHDMRQTRAAVEGATKRTDELTKALAGTRARAEKLEEAREALRISMGEAQRNHADLRADLEAKRTRAEHDRERLEQLAGEAHELAGELERTVAELTGAHRRLDEGLIALQELEGRKPELEDNREQLRADLARSRSLAQERQTAMRDIAIQFESRRSTQSTIEGALARVRGQLDQLTARRNELTNELGDGDEPLVELERQREELLSSRITVDAELAAAREALEAADAALRALEEERIDRDTAVSTLREQMEAVRLAAQETHVRRESLAEQFAATGSELAAISAALPPEAGVAQWEQTLAETRERIEKLGQVNLAAIDEFREQSERKEYLDRQFADLTEALDTLDAAIKKIDRETRSRFQDTFDRVNAGLKEKFPRLFGGGHAYLEMTGEDVLSAGVAVMARPPGKRNSTISQLSGGEKALTAVALVFSIFELNPAPFCLLDEVDAPLDDNNVGRFCDIVRDMSNQVQFIFITHNKSTMELASQLIGVTMSEPGVSRLVAVDVDEAVRMAAM